MYGALPPTTEGEEPAPVSRRPTARSIALAGVGAALLFAAATLASGASGPSPLPQRLDAADTGREESPPTTAGAHGVGGTAATDDAGEMHDDFYQPNAPIIPVDDADDDATVSIVDDAHADADDPSQAQTLKGDAANPSEWADAEVDIDLRAFKSVRKFLEGRNVTFESPDSVVLDYVPKLKLRYNKERIKSTLGPQAFTGYVVMCLDGMGVENDETMSRTASYMVVMTMEGEVVSVRPMPGYDSMGIQPLQVNAMKMRDPRTVLMGTNLETQMGRGPLMSFDWPKASFEVLGEGNFGLGTYTSHDLQYMTHADYTNHVSKYMPDKADVGGDRERVFRPSTTLNIIYAEDIDTGSLQKTIGPFDHKRTNDMNHFQILAEGIVIVNGRSSGSFRKYDMKTDTTIWTCGGAFGNFTLIDLDGTVVEPGIAYHARNETPKMLFDGQHNLEYFGVNDRGQHEYYLFNNGYNQQADSFIAPTSRPMKIVLDEDALTANITWAYETGVRSYIYGDADRLPSGNVLACYWPIELSVNMPEQFDAKVIEIVPDESGAGDDVLAWELLIIGHNCTFGHPGREDGTGCTRASVGDTVPFGWSMYSVERFYMAPLAIDAKLVSEDSAGTKSTLCIADDADTDGDAVFSKDEDSVTFSFTAYDSFKRNLPSVGKWWLELSDGDHTEVVAHDYVEFKAHWKPTPVSFNLTTDSLNKKDFQSNATWTLLIQDVAGLDNRSVAIECS